MPLIPIAAGLAWLAGAFGVGAVVGGTTGAAAATTSKNTFNGVAPWVVAGALAFYIYKKGI